MELYIYISIDLPVESYKSYVFLNAFPVRQDSLARYLSLKCSIISICIVVILSKRDIIFLRTLSA